MFLIYFYRSTSMCLTTFSRSTYMFLIKLFYYFPDLVPFISVLRVAKKGSSMDVDHSLVLMDVI
jgi:hypothetical protein